MKNRTIFVFLLAVTLVFLLAACGGDSSVSSEETATSKETATSEPVVGSESEAGEAGSAPTDPAEESNPYDLDYASDEWQDMSSNRIAVETLATSKETIMSSTDITYEEVVEIIGVEASCYRLDGDSRAYIWYADENENDYLSVLFDENLGSWLISSTDSNL